MDCVELDAYVTGHMSRPRRVLVLDDDPEIRDYLALALDGPDCAVAVAATPAGLEPSAAYDVALVDLLLGDGQTTAPLIARLVKDGVRVVVMTGLSPDAPPVRRARAVGAAAVLQKPFTLTALRDEIGRG